MDDARMQLALRALPPAHHRALRDAGYAHAADFDGAAAGEVAAAAGVPRAAVDGVMRALQGREEPAWLPLAASGEEEEARHILTFSKALDEALGGGVARGRVTEIVGRPGAGKTQLAMQLAVNTCIPAEVGGCDGDVVYLDVEGSVLPRRCRQIAEALVDHLRQGLSRASAGDLDPAYRLKVRNLSVEAVLNRIHVMRVLDRAQVVAALQSLEEILAAHPACKLFVVDSIAFAFRQDADNFAQRSHLLAQVGLALRHAAAKHDIAVVVLNQVTHRPDGALLPALGAAWAPCAETRVWLRAAADPQDAGQRQATVTKHAHHPPRDLRLEVCLAGIRDVLAELPVA